MEYWTDDWPVKEENFRFKHAQEGPPLLPGSQPWPCCGVEGKGSGEGVPGRLLRQGRGPEPEKAGVLTGG